MTSYSPQQSLYSRLSGFSRQSLAASQVARIVGNCFRNPAQMRSRSPLLKRVCVREISCEWRREHASNHGRSGRADPDVWITRHNYDNYRTRSQVTTLSAFAVSHALYYSRFTQISSVLSSAKRSFAGWSFFCRFISGWTSFSYSEKNSCWREGSCGEILIVDGRILCVNWKFTREQRRMMHWSWWDFVTDWEDRWIWPVADRFRRMMNRERW